MRQLAVELGDGNADLEKLVGDVSAGAEVLITRNGHPVARLVPVSSAGGPDRTPGSAKGVLSVPDDFDAPLNDFRDYM
jgi:prevent-host-death family protein